MLDIGANLSHESFASDLDEVLERAWSAGLEAIVVTGSCLESSRGAITLAKRFPGKLYATAGLHPHHASEWDDALEAQFRELAGDPTVVSLGECGLDYFRGISEPADQRRAFASQLAMAVELQRPLFLHQRDAHEDFLAMLREYRAQLASVCVHCFTDTPAAAEEYLSLDCHIGITGWICDERRGQHLEDVVRRIPINRLMVETDSPYLLPRTIPKPQRPKNARRNEPAFLPYVVARIAESRQEDAAAIALQTRDNALRFFRINRS